MAKRRLLAGVQQAGTRIGLALEAIANTGRPVLVEYEGNTCEGVIVDHGLVGSSIRYRVRVRRVGLTWQNTDRIVFT